MNPKPVFDPIADAYDRWYDAPEGKAIFREELLCLQELCGDGSGRWLEVGVGTGRFAAALGIAYGLDVSREMAARAAGRGVRVLIGRAERMPLRTGAFDGMLMALTLCFLDHPEAALRECARILRPGGRLVIGTVPADSPWGRAYIRKGQKGHPAYSHARFYTIPSVLQLAGEAGFRLERGRSALLWEPETRGSDPVETTPGIRAGAGFVGLLLRGEGEQASDRGPEEGSARLESGR